MFASRNFLLPFVGAMTAVCYLILPASLSAVTIASTDALSPEEQQKRFNIPDGFVIELVVAEPDIGQPMNLNFDARGRLWVSSSIEYPFPAKGDVDKPGGRFSRISGHPPGDWLTVVSNLDQSGRAKTVRRFASGLNIPIGAVPLGDGSSVLAYDIPSIRMHEDTDGDGKADKNSTVYTRFGHGDTHGMANSFTRWADGWIYGCHGFSNRSSITDGRGVTTKLFSGNTIRFRPDGSIFEQFTWGQVNPFGITFDALGNLYNADCHSMPVYMLLRGGTYLRPSWAQPKADSLGFVPKMIDHNHGSTGICGPAIYDAPEFPPKYRNSLFLCNPVSGKVHWDKLRAVGSTRFVETQPDFITCDDPWFRPVDAVVGPDGALYVADFYNAIIGHYEVKLEHPKRDRAHGRVWRIRYQGDDEPLPTLPDLTKETLPDLVQRLGDKNLATRVMALNYLVDSHGKAAVPVLKKAMIKGSEELVAYGMWALERIEGLEEQMLGELAKGKTRLPRVFAMKILAERSKLTPFQQELVVGGLQDPAPTTRRAAADALIRHPLTRSVKPLFAALSQAKEGDSHLIHVIRMALRRQLQSIDDWDQLARTIPESDKDHLVVMASVIGSDAASSYAATQISLAGIRKLSTENFEQLMLYCRMIGKLPENAASSFVGRLREAGLDRSLQARILLDAIGGGEIAAGWAQSLALELMAAGQGTVWEALEPAEASPWVTQRRKSSDGQSALFWSSLPRGEKLTGILRSPTFKAPEKMTFYMAGHDNPPSKELGVANYVRLIESSTGTELMRSRPPRNDTARQVAWELKEHRGKDVQVELVDGHKGSGYAWLAVGRFAPAVLTVHSQDERQVAIELVRTYRLREMAQPLVTIMNDVSAPFRLRAEAGSTLLDLSDNYLEQVLEVMKVAPAVLQQRLANSVARNDLGVRTLLNAIEGGKVTAHLLRDKQLVERIRAMKIEGGGLRLRTLLSKLPTTEVDLSKLLIARRTAYLEKQRDAVKGKAAFATYCASCHHLGGQGGSVGPSLEGVGVRGLDRLLEDLLDPDRNVDPAFATTTITTKDGAIVVGIGVLEKGSNLEITDAEGKRRKISRSNVSFRKTSNLSLMSSALTRSIPEADFANLMQYLLEQK